MSRLRRSNVDWHRLLEVFALFGTLIADLDGLYDPALYNGRLLLGLKGTMSEEEGQVMGDELVANMKKLLHAIYAGLDTTSGVSHRHQYSHRQSLYSRQPQTF